MKIIKFRPKRRASQSFEACVVPHIEQLYRLAYRFCGKREDAEDLVQDLLIKVYPLQKELSGLDDPKPWLAKVLYRLFIDQRRRIKSSPVVPIEDLDLNIESVTDNRPGLEKSVADLQQIARLQQSFDKLSEDHRVLIGLFDIEGYSLTEIQQILDISPGTIKSRLHRARAQLKKYLHEGTF